MISEKFTRLDPETVSKISDVCKHTYQKCKPYFKHTRIALDVGSKEGEFAKHMCNDFDLVHMFDMRPKMRWRNVNRTKVKLHRCALGNRIGQIQHTGPWTNTNVENLQSILSTVKTIDSFQFEHVDFIKIDVEGDEQAVLEGAINTLATCKPVIVLEQNHTTEQYGKGKYGDAVRWLEGKNYQIVDYDGIDDWIMMHV